MTALEFLSFLAGVGSGMTISDSETAFRVLYLMLENPDVHIRHKRGAPYAVIEINTKIDLSQISTIKKS